MTREEKLNYLGQLLMDGKKIANNDEELIQRLEANSKAQKDSKKKAFNRLLNTLHEKYPQIKIEKKGKVSYFYLETKISIVLHEYLTSSDDMSWLIQMINSGNKELFAELEKDTKERLSKVLSREKDIFLYQNSPFEVFEREKGKQVFRALKSAVKNNEYRDIYYNYNNKSILKDVKCLKLIFMENNWYVAIARKVEVEKDLEKIKEDKLFFLRISFIEKVKYSARNSYQANQLYKYRDFFKTFQNPMTLYGVKKRKATILASPNVAKYFKPNMKKHLASQIFVKEHDNGTVEFTLDYTQPIEILPFIKKWLPDLKILSPKSLADKLEDDLKSYLK